jgi:uncharacterized metal-binding protein
MKTAPPRKVMVIPCSGIGKPLGSVSREAVYELVENIRKDITETVCLALLVSEDKEAFQLVRENKCIAVDGCPMQCAEKNLKHIGGNLVASFRVIDTLKQNKKLKPRSITFLDRDGLELAATLANQVAKKVDDILSK